VTFIGSTECHSRRPGGEVDAYDAASGRLRWRREVGPTESSPLVVDGEVVVGDWNGKVWGLAARTGRTLWRTSTGSAVKGSVAFSGGRLFIGNYGGKVIALAPRSGRILWANGGHGPNYAPTSAASFGAFATAAARHYPWVKKWLIWDEPNQRAIFHRPLTGKLARKIIDHARDMFEETIVSCEILDKWYTDKHVEAYTTETGRLFRPNEVAPLEAFVNQPITKLLLLGARPMIDLLEPVLRDEFPGVRVLRSDPELLQIMHSDASKAAALGMVAEFYNVPMERVMAIGDATNDIPMLEAAGVAIAMDNAHPAVKQIADWVAPSNNDHGVHAALVRYGLA